MMNIVQFSDCHIGQSKENSTHLTSIVDSILKHSPDIVIASGDLTQHGTLSEYLEFAHITKALTNLYVIAGNHDNWVNMKKVFHPWQYRSFTHNGYAIKLIDSKVEGKVSGYIDPSRITVDISSDVSADFEACSHSLVFTHHPILPMESSWDDSMSITNMDEVSSEIDEHILLVGFGHAHQAKEFSIGLTKVCACPSTAYGFENPSEWGYNLYSIHDTQVSVTTIVMQ